jgi:hypothetical protein|nr:MAG TPA: Protein of unknown function (DUF1642) [Caudoviricetes sp.]
MNKQELISIIRTEVLLAKSIPERKGYIAGLEEAINIIEGFSNEPQKPVVPQYIADFIEEQKKYGLTLSYSIDASMSDRVAEWYWDNPELFARAWLDGYTVEKEKRYTVKVKGDLGQYLGKYYLNNEKLTPQFIRTQKHEGSVFTKAELEETGFDWVFDCEGMEVQEVE